MFIRRKNHNVPGLNTTSTADISFMLLIFFLVTTSMDVDKGLSRQLPPPEPPKKEQMESQVQKDKLMELHRNHSPLEINISDPKKEGKKGLFSKTYSTYNVKCPQINTDVRRSYLDFEWFHSQLSLRYPLRLIPPIVKENVVKQIENLLKLENEEYIELRKMRYLQKFMDSILKINLLKTSPILYMFLKLDEEKFKDYQNKLNNKKYELSISLDNMITIKGKLSCEYKDDTIKKANENNKK